MHMPKSQPVHLVHFHYAIILTRLGNPPESPGPQESVGRGGRGPRGGNRPLGFFAHRFTLFQPWGVDFSTKLLLASRFLDLPTALQSMAQKASSEFITRLHLHCDFIGFNQFKSQTWTAHKGAFSQDLAQYRKVNSVQEPCTKYFAVHLLKFDILQIK